MHPMHAGPKPVGDFSNLIILNKTKENKGITGTNLLHVHSKINDYDYKLTVCRNPGQI